MTRSRHWPLLVCGATMPRPDPYGLQMNRREFVTLIGVIE